MRMKNMTQNQTQATESANKKISTYLTMIVLIVMALAVTALFIAFKHIWTAINSCRRLSGIGIIALVLYFYSTNQSYNLHKLKSKYLK
jgi:hypothetical protein